jgi:hypothetical protein
VSFELIAKRPTNAVRRKRKRSGEERAVFHEVKKTTVADNKKDKEFTDFEKIGK